MIARRSIAVGAVALAGAAVLASWATIPSAARHLALPGDWPVQIRGVFHIHTRRSDGTGTIETVAREAARAGLRFAIVTDHGDGTRPPAPPAYRSGVLCIDAVELSTSGGHYAALGLPAAPYPLGGEPADVVEDVARMGGFGIVTHPDSPRASLAWKGSLAQADGLEWLNGDSAWRDESWLRLAGVVFHYPWRPAEVIAQTLDSAGAALARWDREARVRPTVAIAGNDAHGGFSLDAGERDYEARPVIRVPSYAASFGSFSLVVSLSAALTGDAAEDARLVVSAVRRGHLATVIDGFAKPGAFTFTASSGTATAQQGDRIAPSGPVRLVARSNAPAGSTIVLKRDGREIGRWTDAALHHLVGPERAAYRVEIWLSGAERTLGVPWVMSNPIYVGYEPSPTVPIGAGAASPGPDAIEPSFGSWQPVQPARWMTEHAPGSAIRLDDDARAPTGSVAFTVALSGGGRSGQYAAVVAPLAAGQAAGSLRVRFRASSDRPCRLSMQLRQPAGRNGWRWVRSVYLDAAPRDIVVSLDDLRATEPGSPARPDLARVDAMLFTVDTMNLAPGDRRSIRLAGVAFERGDRR